MPILIYGVAFALIITKFLDCYTTAKNITHTGQERNPWARRAMRRFGVQTVIWGIFALVVLIVLVSVAWVRWVDLWYYDLAFLLFGALIALIQALVAWSNHTGRQNQLIRWLSHQFQKF